MFQSKFLIYLCILVATGLGWWGAFQLSSEFLDPKFDRKVLHQNIEFCFCLLFYGAAILGAAIGGWKQKKSLRLVLIGMTVGLIFFALLGPWETSIESYRYQLRSYDLVIYRTKQNAIGMLLGGFLFLFWPETSRLLNRSNSKKPNDSMDSPGPTG